MSKKIIFLLCAFCLASCQTYKTYYGITYKSLEEDKQNKIYRLDLSYQNLKTLPDYIKNLNNLMMINLSGNTELILEEAIRQLEPLPKLKVLILDSMHLKQLPENFYTLRQLEHLSLVNNPDLDYVDAFGKIKDFSLEFLNLSQNQLQDLPENLSEITTLRDLKLSRNRLNTADVFLTLAALPNLRSLWLDNNQISALAPEIAALNQLRFLYIDANKLSSLPETMPGLNHLLVMHAAQNEFTELPGVLTRMPRLLFVIFSNNPIDEIPPIFHRNDYPLFALIMDGNRLDEQEKKFYQKMFRRFFIFSAR